ncbi:MAG: hypothetical protein NWT00_08195, partial [Beijerinckiaceae bacterium]|nr:hypothetical protein [Beijerinckiaceae bacterium]
MNRTKWFWGNFFAFFLLLATPYAHGVKIYGMFFETANLLALALFAAVALVLACITMAVSNRIVLISICCCLLVLFVDFMSDILEPALQLENTGTWGIIGFAAFAAALAGLFTAMWFLAGNLTVVIISTCGAILASTIVMAGFTVFSSSPGTWSKPQAASASAEKLPVYIHLILDEQTGLAALDKTIPPQARLRADIQEFFTGNGFRIFPHAYAQYFQTLETIPAMLNFAAPANVNPLIQENKSGGTNAINAIRFTLAKNSYFDALMKQGYRLHVYQSNWLGFCGPYASTISSCNTYPYIVSQLSLARYPFMERAYILYRLYLSQSLFARMSYRALVAAGDGSVGKGFLYRANWSKLPGPPVALPV